MNGMGEKRGSREGEGREEKIASEGRRDETHGDNTLGANGPRALVSESRITANGSRQSLGPMTGEMRRTDVPLQSGCV